ncbi:hypothetical protein TREMEDRAFT_57961 [Tremella mesenterica DSM 1558]|uniref:uncharacterized protein n=1 Tax=Tremella mesenterica (strain ATCC 24925 / CBS 8224 / DSM 1558 / NBRC 9311 / NRRL Y-6157 / RJB 2259-6 / UBC 559-6) TaxID=578456 RepID=UPI00032BB040|nr:uncharacterized protein TREMEDRAFT_57961 [Tremella mesenterica DSM 1558]EIW65702.1 hypothetical protein TREMEDRAFT_57961 [Tremella mesenterica DSM 1558]
METKAQNCFLWVHGAHASLDRGHQADGRVEASATIHTLGGDLFEEVDGRTCARIVTGERQVDDGLEEREMVDAVGMEERVDVEEGIRGGGEDR